MNNLKFHKHKIWLYEFINFAIIVYIVHLVGWFSSCFSDILVCLKRVRLLKIMLGVPALKMKMSWAFLH